MINKSQSENINHINIDFLCTSNGNIIPHPPQQTCNYCKLFSTISLISCNIFFSLYRQKKTSNSITSKEKAAKGIYLVWHYFPIFAKYMTSSSWPVIKVWQCDIKEKPVIEPRRQFLSLIPAPRIRYSSYHTTPTNLLLITEKDTGFPVIHTIHGQTHYPHSPG